MSEVVLDDELTLLREQLAQMKQRERESQEEIKRLKERTRDLCVSAEKFTVDFECLEEDEKSEHPRVTNSEEKEMEDIKVQILAALRKNAKGEMQLEVWPKLSTNKCYDLTLFTELQFTLPNAANGSPAVLSGLGSELVRVSKDAPLECRSIVVPDWNMRYSPAVRGQKLQLTVNVKIVHSLSEVREGIETNRKDSKRDVEVTGKKLSVNMTYLTAWSAELAELSKNPGVVTVEGCAEEDFEEMLRVVYPSSKPVSARNVESLLKVAQKLKMYNLTRKCEHFLNECGRHNLSEIQLLTLADEYGLDAIKMVVLERILTSAGLKTLVLDKEEDYNMLSPEMKSLIDTRYRELHVQELNKK